MKAKESYPSVTAKKMRPFRSCPASTLEGIRIILTDIDDTITCHGLLPSRSILAMERLSEAGIRVIPVTGRPAGWCDHIARMWPVEAVIGENGALYLRYDRMKRKMTTYFTKSEAERKADSDKLRKLAEIVFREVPGAGLASDQPYRVADLAIDFCEDVPPLTGEEVQKIQDILEAGGATTKVSSIHVNAWFGTYNKLTTTGKCLKDLFNMEIEEANDTILFTGDSPNDAPMFAYFNNSVGMANVRGFELPAEPVWVTREPDAAGFAEVADAVISAKKVLVQG